MIRSTGCVLVVIVGLMGPIGCRLPDVQDAGQRFDRMAVNDSALEAVRLTDPDFYAGLRRAAVNAGGSGKSSAEINQATRDAFRRYIMAKSDDLASAPDESLLLTFEAERDLILKLQSVDVERCADFAMGNNQESQYRRYSSELDYLQERATIARLIASKEGRDSPVDRSEAGPGDYAAIYEEMMRWSVPERLARQALEVGLDGRTVDEQCDTGVAYYEAILVQPTPRATRLIASLQRSIAKSVKATS